MTYGYSQRIVERNRQASDRLIGVRLGRVCIEQQVPVSVVAREFKVTRQTVYNWFSGVSSPADTLRARMDVYLANLS
jgi:DNA-binding transcriptional regulator YiaG